MVETERDLNLKKEYSQRRIILMAYLAHVRQYLQSLLILKWQNIKWSTKKAIL